MSRKMSKAESQRWHFKHNIRDRYGIFCNRDTYWYIVDCIKNGCDNATFIMKQSNTRTLYRLLLPVEILDARSRLQVTIENDVVRVYVVYDKLRGELNTALPWYESDEKFMQDYLANHEYVRC